jgi:SHS2 domain-containing protein
MTATQLDPDRRRHRWLDHTSEEELVIEAESPEAIFAEALAALVELLGAARGGGQRLHHINLDARDLPTLLAAWLDELVYRAETDELIPEELERVELAGTHLEATIRGRRATGRTLVKGITYNRLQMKKFGDRWRARVVLDV